MKKLIAFLIIFIGLISCEKPYVTKPDNLISQSDMEDILVDLYLTQQMVNSSSSSSSNYILDHAKNSKYILDQHEVTTKAFENSYKYYFAQPSTYQKILDNVKDDLYSKLSDEEKKRIEDLKSQTE